MNWFDPKNLDYMYIHNLDCNPLQKHDGWNSINNATTDPKKSICQVRIEGAEFDIDTRKVYMDLKNTTLWNPGHTLFQSFMSTI